MYACNTSCRAMGTRERTAPAAAPAVVATCSAWQPKAIHERQDQAQMGQRDFADLIGMQGTQIDMLRNMRRKSLCALSQTYVHFVTGAMHISWSNAD